MRVFNVRNRTQRGQTLWLKTQESGISLPVGLQAAVVGAMLLGSFVEAEVGSVEASTSQQGRAGHAQKSCWENGEFSV